MSRRDDAATGDVAALGQLQWQTISEAILRLQLDLDRAWTLGELAQAMGYASPHFATLFRQVVGEPPLRYLRSLRLERAAQALLDREGSVLQIALEAGYTSAEAFTRAFRRATGCSPLAFRRRATGPRADPRRRPPMAHHAAVEGVPAGLELPPVAVELGPLHGWTLATSFAPDAIARALDVVLRALPPDGPWQVGGLAQPWGWVEGPRSRELRCVRFSTEPLRTPPPPLQPWRMPRAWLLAFEYRGPIDGIVAACHFIVETWIVRMGMRAAFGPMISQLEGPPTATGQVHARLYASVRALGDVFGARDREDPPTTRTRRRPP